MDAYVNYGLQLLGTAAGVVGIMMGFYTTVLSVKTYTGAKVAIGLVLATGIWMLGAATLLESVTR